MARVLVEVVEGDAVGVALEGEVRGDLAKVLGVGEPLLGKNLGNLTITALEVYLYAMPQSHWIEPQGSRPWARGGPN